VFSIAELSSHIKGIVQEGQAAQRQRTGPNKREQAGSGLPATDEGTRSLWFSPLIDDHDCCRQLTRHRGAEALPQSRVSTAPRACGPANGRKPSAVRGCRRLSAARKRCNESLAQPAP